jgi:hypothetical protein
MILKLFDEINLAFEITKSRRWGDEIDEKRRFDGTSLWYE